VNTVAFTVVAKVPIERFRAWGQERGWRFAPLFSSANNTFKRDYWKLLDGTPDGRTVSEPKLEY